MKKMDVSRIMQKPCTAATVSFFFCFWVEVLPLRAYENAKSSHAQCSVFKNTPTEQVVV